MSLATRCASCGTVFRVVQDQLRVSSGWVRCGRCGEVFDAIESLVDMAPKPASESATLSVGRTQPPADMTVTAPGRSSSLGRPADEAPAEDPIPARSEATAAVTSPPDPPAAARVEAPKAPEAPEAPAVPPEVPAATVAADAGAPAQRVTEAPEAPPAPEPTEPTESEFAPTEVPASMFPPTGFVDYAAESAVDPPAFIATAEAIAPEAAPDAHQPQPTAAEMPAFVVRAERAARWRHPRVRRVLVACVCGAAAGLAWQSLSSHHDWVAARWPVLRPLVARVCLLSTCEIEPPRHIEGLAVDSSALTKTATSGQYALAVTLRNRAAMDVRVPALDLTLTDATGQVTVRRVLTPEDLGVGHGAIPAQGELIIKSRLGVDSAPVVGYTIGLFYP